MPMKKPVSALHARRQVFFCFLQAVLLLQKPRERLYPTEPLVLWGSGVGRPWVGPGQLLNGQQLVEVLLVHL